MRKTLTKNTSPIGMSSKSPDRSIAPPLRALRARAAVTPARDDDDDDDENTDGGRVHSEREARVCDMAKAKCVHPARPVAKACGDCPRRK